MRLMTNAVLRALVRYGFVRKTPAFLHVPKTGGTYLAQRESDNTPVISPLKYLGHFWVTSLPQGKSAVYPPEGYRPEYVIEKRALAPYFVFTTVRNPFAFLVSYLWHAGGINPKYHDPNHYDFSNARKGFDYLLKTIVNRNAPWPSRKLIHGQLFCDDGDLIIDWVNHTESLDLDLSRMAERFGIRFQRKSRQRIGHRDDYRTYYTEELIDLVNATWNRELKLFGYEFHGRSEEPAVLNGEITPDQKRRIKYFWERDELLIDGALFNGNITPFAGNIVDAR